MLTHEAQVLFGESLPVSCVNFVFVFCFLLLFLFLFMTTEKYSEKLQVFSTRRILLPRVVSLPLLFPPIGTSSALVVDVHSQTLKTNIYLV